MSDDKLLKLKGECFDIDNQIKYLQSIYKAKIDEIQKLLISSEKNIKPIKKAGNKKK